MSRDRRTPTLTLPAAVLLLLPALAIAVPVLSGDTAGAMALVVPLLAAGLSAAALAFALVTFLRPRQDPAPVRVRAQRRNTPSPSRVEFRGRPERPRAPGCGL
ncbi:hypothetical protein [Agilicoccus flavus]|uniref:hypothetical protein n=1 Tax=Agilicoccus flavus TaxID=2775968 RepID=UPI001CF6E43A|nr:hypothetical protein [Agilicoccus flavus]